MPGQRNRLADLNIPALRAETPGCRNVIHLNNAGASLPSQSTIQAIESWLHLEADIGGYEAALKERTRLEAVYSHVASLINASADEIALTTSATDAWNTIFYSLTFKPGERILTGSSEYASNYIAMLQQAKRHDINIEIIPDNEHGETDIEQLANMMDDDVRLVALTHVPTNNGLVNPARKVGEIVSAHRALYLLDACQSVGQIPVDIQAIQCDFLTATGRKYLRGPRGTGFLYARKECLKDLEPAQIDIRAADWIATHEYRIREDAKRFERWETSHALRMGLDNAITTALDLGIENIETRITGLASHLRQALRAVPI